MSKHENLDTVDHHKVGYVQSSDPGAIGTGKVWIDTSAGAGAWSMKIRNTANDGWESMTGAAAMPIFLCSSTTGATVTGGGTITVDWQETQGYRKDTGFTHSTSVDPDEITIDEAGWYLITVDLGFLDSALDGFTQYTLVVEHYNGSTWEDIANRGGTESGAWTWTRGGADEPDTAFFSATNFVEVASDGDKLRTRLQVSSSAGTPNAGLDDEKCRILIQKKQGA